MKLKIEQRLLLITFVSLVSLSCHGLESEGKYTSIKSPPAKLINDVESYQPIGVAEDYLQLDETSKKVIEDTGLAPGDNRPPFDIYSVSYNFSHLGCDGELVLLYFNNRLQSTWFYSNDINEYLAHLKENGVPQIAEKDKFPISQYARMWWHKDFRDRPYVAWEDVRLSEEQAKWISRYS